MTVVGMVVKEEGVFLDVSPHLVIRGGSGGCQAIKRSINQSIPAEYTDSILDPRGGRIEKRAIGQYNRIQ